MTERKLWQEGALGHRLTQRCSDPGPGPGAERTSTQDASETGRDRALFQECRFLARSWESMRSRDDMCVGQPLVSMNQELKRRVASPKEGHGDVILWKDEKIGWLAGKDLLTRVSSELAESRSLSRRMASICRNLKSSRSKTFMLSSSASGSLWCDLEGDLFSARAIGSRVRSVMCVTADAAKVGWDAFDCKGEAGQGGRVAGVPGNVPH
jgi:hypothetical protein